MVKVSIKIKGCKGLKEVDADAGSFPSWFCFLRLQTFVPFVPVDVAHFNVSNSWNYR
jgi:hypothetical protein